MSFKKTQVLKRSKSTGCLQALSEYWTRDIRFVSESSVEVDGDFSRSEDEVENAGDEVLEGLERKIDKLNDLFEEQCALLSEIKEKLHDSKTIIEQSELAQNQFIAELFKKAPADNPTDVSENTIEPAGLSSSFNSRARSLLAAIESQGCNVDRELKMALLDCLQSEELKERMVSATVESVRDMLGNNFSREMSRLYVPMLQRAHRRLAWQLTRAIEDAFADLEAHSVQLSNSMYRMTRSMRHALDRYQGMMKDEEEGRHSYMRCIVEETLQNEIREWRHLAVEALCADAKQAEDVRVEWAERGATPPLMEYPASTPQPANPEISIIDQLMTTAEINKLIQDGDVNAAFEVALSAADLALVMAACRAADPKEVFAPYRLKQSTLLSLAQQLPTDMVHDTQLKCRYLEEALLNLNPKNPATSAHLPLVVGEIRTHLTKFLSNYPYHVASRRISLIIMAADNLLK